MLASNHTNLIALQSIQRAFLFTEGAQFLRNANAQGVVDSIVFRFVLKNSGMTPTRHMTSHVSHGYYPNGLPRKFSFPDERADTSTPLDVGPHGETGIENGPFSASKIEDVLSGRTRLYFWGWARYHDIFEGTPEHITEFCLELVGVDGDPFSPSQSQPGVASFRACAVHNCYDDECQRQ
jgi:hypothetical protein